MGSKSSKLDIYWNLHRGLWSVKDRGQGIVVLHQPVLIANEVSFIVQPAGRAKVIAAGKKNVHAFVRCDSVDLKSLAYEIVSQSFIRVRYNPCKWNCFVDEDSKPVYTAKIVALTDDGKCYAKI